MSSQDPILIRNGTVVNDDSMFRADVLCENGKITAVGLDITVPENCREVDATDRLILPGGIDPHTHFQMPFMGQVACDDFEHGTRAALSGGTTMIIDFIIPSKQQTPLEAYTQWRGWADPKVCCDYALSCALTSWNDETTPTEMRTLTEPDYGINSFKFFLAYKDVFMVRDDEFFRGLKRCREIGALARVHAENGDVIHEKQQELLALGITGPEGHPQSRPEELEAEATNRACVLAAEANCPLYVVHVMSKGAADVIAQHRQRGNVVFGEPIAAGLALWGEHYFASNWDHAAAYILSPPLSRNSNTPEVLMDLLACGQLHLTGTDNCTFTCQQKRAGLSDFTKIPNGVNGVEDRLSIIWEKGVRTGKLDPMRFVAVTSTTAAKIFNCYPQKGRIAVDADADIVIWNPNSSRRISAKTHHHKHDFNIFEGMIVHGTADVTITGGRIAWIDGQLNVEAGSGRFISLPPFSPFVFASNSARAESIIEMTDSELAIKRFTEYLQIKTEQPNPDYKSCTHFLLEYAKELGLESWIHECVEGKPLVGMTLKGTDPSLSSLLLSSHVDTVPTFPEFWTHDPYSAHREENGNIYARGAQDMKCVGIQYMEALRKLLEERKQFRRTIHLLWSPDEEIGSPDGMKRFVKTEEFKKLNCGFALDEGLASSNETYKVYYGERNVWWIKVRCTGTPGHGSRFQENTAAAKLQSVINNFLKFREEQHQKLEQNKDLTLGDVITVNLTKVDGGVQINVIPAEFHAYFDVRVPPTTDFKAFETQIGTWCKEAGPDVTFEFVEVNRITNTTAITKDNPWWRAFSGVMDELNCKISTEIFTGATDSRFLRDLGYSAIGFSPMNNTPVLLHDHNEFLNDKVFLRGIDIYVKLIERLANVEQ
ncbi:Amidohydro-rel domain-containing protein [Aphelenchoides besseyi]|nr:Amidohydro-rel domain-containing protein [Aphelenchoides besseyi]KAI6200592.1 Amidohydro-rel domain-containing protein [Aphelenchoides besseyi]